MWSLYCSFKGPANRTVSWQGPSGLAREPETKQEVLSCLWGVKGPELRSHKTYGQLDF